MPLRGFLKVDSSGREVIGTTNKPSGDGEVKKIGSQGAPGQGLVCLASRPLGLELDHTQLQIIEGPTHFCFHLNHPANLPLISKLPCPVACGGFVCVYPPHQGALIRRPTSNLPFAASLGGLENGPLNGRMGLGLRGADSTLRPSLGEWRRKPQGRAGSLFGRPCSCSHCVGRAPAGSQVSKPCLCD